MTMHEDEQRLTASLRELASADRTGQPPPRLEQAVLVQWEALRAMRPVRGSFGTSQKRAVEMKPHVRWVVASLVGVAAMMTIAAALWLRAPGSVATDTRATAPHDVLPLALPVPDTRAALSKHKTGHPRQRVQGAALSRRRSSGLGDRRDVPDVAVFVPLLPVTEQDRNDALQIVRVRLPRSALIGFGVPIDESHAAEPLQADVLLGEDGLARGIRFVRN